MREEKKENVDRFKTAKYASELTPELMASMSPRAYSLYILCDQLNLLKAGSIFARLGFEVLFANAFSLESVKNAHNKFDQATQLAMRSPFLTEKEEVNVVE